MDYTDLARVKASMDSVETAKDSVLQDYISRASRLIDTMITGVPGVSDYLLQEDIVDEALTNGVIDFAGRLSVWPHKPFISRVNDLSYRWSLRDPWKVADVALTSIEYETVVFEGSLFPAEKMYVKISYTGGFGKLVSDLPGDIVETATLLTVRLYKEARSGVGDSIGVPELGTLVYTKAYPSRVIDTIRHYERIAPWT